MKKIFWISVMALMAIPVVASAVGPIPGTGPNAYLYHSDAGLICTDCHAQNAKSAMPAGNSASGGGTTIGLKKDDITDLCLSCHTEGHNTPYTAELTDVAPGNWTAPIVKTAQGVVPQGVSMPAGDFYWSNMDPRNGHNPAYSKGSNAVPTSKQMVSDSILGNKPPGGEIKDGEWSCHSCHGSHSRFDAGVSPWRQLKRRVNNVNVTGDVSMYEVESAKGSVAQDPTCEPIKSNSRGDIQEGVWLNMRRDSNPLEGADLFRAESDTNKNVYRGGFSSFCAACHGDFHGGNNESGSSYASANRVGGQWIRHPSNLRLGKSSRYGIAAYTAAVSNVQRTNPNPAGYDWKYPLVKADYDFSVKSAEASSQVRSLSGDDRIMCLTCHKAHASRFRNMTRWDTSAHAFIRNGEADFTGEASRGDNPAYGCGKCHQMGGTTAFVRTF